MDSIKVMLVDYRTEICDSIRDMLQGTDDITVIADASDELEAIDRARRYQPDVVLIDLNIPDLDSLEITRRLTLQLPSISVVTFTIDNQAPNGQTAAVNFLLKNASGALMINTIRAIKGSGASVRINLLHEAVMVLKHGSGEGLKTTAGVASMPQLTPRERQVLRLLTIGWTSQEIGREIGISISTVRRYLTSLRKKMEASDIDELAITAIQRGLVPHF